MRNPVSRTAYYCAGTRMLDAGRPDSLLGDTLAERFMGEEGLAIFERFRHLRVPIGAHQVRCHLIDKLVRERLGRDPQTRIFLVGAGFDSRAFRIAGGRWVEIDEAGVIERKEQVAPSASCGNPLERITIDFARESLRERLASQACAAPVLVICEGVSMYLEPEQADALAATLKSLFPRHTLVADLMTKRFGESFARGMTKALATVGTGFRGLEPAPLARWERNGYRVANRVSLIGEAMAMNRVPIPAFLRHVLWAAPTMRDGYQLATMEYEA